MPDPQHDEPPPDPSRDPPSATVDLVVRSTDLLNAVAKGMAEELGPHDLSPLEFSLLRVCAEKSEVTATELAVVLPVDASRISRVVTRLVDKGLLSRRRLRNDRRIVMLRLSDEGAALTARLHQRLRAYDVRLTKNIAEEDLDVFASVVSRILANYMRIASPPPPPLNH